MFALNLRGDSKPTSLELPSQVFSVTGAIKFALIVATVLLISSVLSVYFGNTAIIVTVALAGLASTNSAAVALGSLAAAGQISAIDGTLPLAAALTANTVVRIWIALRSGEPSFRRTVAGGLILQIAGIWLGWWLGIISWEWITELFSSLPIA